jgi:biotin carboxyl carrier protein
VAGEGAKVTAPLPGTITEVKVTVGQAVKAGETVIILEAMKMQNNIEAENSGTVTSILVGQGDAVMEGATLITIG